LSLNVKLNLRISEEETKIIVDFAKKQQKNPFLFQSNGKSRQFSILNLCQDTVVRDLSIKLWKEKYEELQIYDYEEEPLFGLFLGVNNDGGNVHEHTDPAKLHFNHIRLNFMLSKPSNGGNPVIENQEIEIQEGECWLNIADRWKHKSTPVIGEKDRIVLSLGSLVPEKTVNTIFNNL
jgi:hypothetical protein